MSSPEEAHAYTLNLMLSPLMLLFLLIANGLRKRLPVIGIFLATAAAATYASSLFLRA